MILLSSAAGMMSVSKYTENKCLSFCHCLSTRSNYDKSPKKKLSSTRWQSPILEAFGKSGLDRGHDAKFTE